MFRFVSRLALGGALWLALGAAASADGIEVRDAWIRQPPPGGSAAGYLTLANHGDTARELVGVRSDAAERVELHRTRVEDGVARMRRVESIELPAGGEVVLAPRGLHLMLIRPRALKEGDEVELKLELDGDELLSTRATVRREATSAHDHVH